MFLKAYNFCLALICIKFTSARIKGSDASWENDEEPPAECVDFSDDEKERAIRAKKKADKRKRQR